MEKFSVPVKIYIFFSFLSFLHYHFLSHEAIIMIVFSMGVQSEVLDTTSPFSMVGLPMVWSMDPLPNQENCK
jgi:hypothetical protein